MNRFRVMILEDDPSRIRSFKTILELQAQDVSYHTEADDFIDTLKKEKKVDLMLLDHDLGGKVYVDERDSNTGSAVARFLSMDKEGERFKSTKIVIHSFNGPAAKYMMDLLRNAGYDAMYVPGMWTKDVFRSVITMEVV